MDKDRDRSIRVGTEGANKETSGTGYGQMQQVRDRYRRESTDRQTERGGAEPGDVAINKTARTV